MEEARIYSKLCGNSLGLYSRFDSLVGGIELVRSIGQVEWFAFAKTVAISVIVKGLKHRLKESSCGGVLGAFWMLEF